jgi:xanthine/CO dehydrogenase XdhC/CoxF family maturation factor
MSAGDLTSISEATRRRLDRDSATETFTINVKRSGGWRPWTASLVVGVSLYESGITRGWTQGGAVKGAMRKVAREVVRRHFREVVVEVSVDPDGWQQPAGDQAQESMKG